LARTKQADLDATEAEMDHWRDTLDAFDHACGDCCKKQFGRIECIGSPRHVGIEDDLCVFAAGRAGVGVDPPGHDFVFQHLAVLSSKGPVSSATMSYFRFCSIVDCDGSMVRGHWIDRDQCPTSAADYEYQGVKSTVV
jgi:hypothetical protein